MALFRATAGIWPSGGQGPLIRPPLEEIFFLPQQTVPSTEDPPEGLLLTGQEQVMTERRDHGCPAQGRSGLTSRRVLAGWTASTIGRPCYRWRSILLALTRGNPRTACLRHAGSPMTASSQTGSGHARRSGGFDENSITLHHFPPRDARDRFQALRCTVGDRRLTVQRNWRRTRPSTSAESGLIHRDTSGLQSSPRFPASLRPHMAGGSIGFCCGSGRPPVRPHSELHNRVPPETESLLLPAGVLESLR